jgi:transmembrane sensor
MDRKLLLRYIAGEASEEEKLTVTGWLDSSPENMKEFLALRKLYDITLWQQPKASASVEKKSKIIPFRQILTGFSKVAAIFVLAFMLFRWMDRPPRETAAALQTLYVPAGQRAELALADGSKVWLNANTTFTFPTAFSDNSREVTLKGEGYFDIAHNPHQPFTVKTSGFDVHVLGTEFNLMADQEKGTFEVALLKGSVEVTRRGSDKRVSLAPDQRLFLKENRLYTSEITHPAYFLWKEGIISFDDEPFSGMVKTLERYFDLTIEVRNEKILAYRCTGKFRTKDGVEHILKVLQLSNRFTFRIDDKLNKITIE